MLSLVVLDGWFAGDRPKSRIADSAPISLAEWQATRAK
jgi:hypothetical protein